MDVEHEILGLLVEDYYELWEVHVQVPVERDLLVSAITGLLRGDRATWVFREHDSAIAVPLHAGLAVPDLQAEASWRPTPLECSRVLLGVTGAGEAAYFGGQSQKAV